MGNSNKTQTTNQSIFFSSNCFIFKWKTEIENKEEDINKKKPSKIFFFFFFF